MSRLVAPGFHWIQEIGPARPGIVATALARGATWVGPDQIVHVPQNAFLLVGEKSLLFDTLSPASTDHILRELEEILGDRGLDYLAVSHPDLPHAANTFPILERYPNAQLVAPRYGEAHGLYHLDRAWQVGEGDTIDLGGHIARFHEATFLDAGISMWMSEERTRTLFTVDWLGCPILDHEGLRFMDEIEDPDPDRFYDFHARVLFWLQYVDVARVQRETARLESRFDPLIIAPAHGPVIRDEIRRFMRIMHDIPGRVRETGRVGVL